MTYSKHGLLTNPSFFNFVQEKMITIVPFSIALIAIIRYSDSITWLLIYLGIVCLHMTHIYLNRCPHCAYYKTEGRFHKCLWIQFIPKIMKGKSSPVPKYIRFYTPVAVSTITFYPIYWLTSQWDLLLLYALSWCVLALSLYTAGCARCTDFSCKFNAVPQEVRYEYMSPQPK